MLKNQIDDGWGNESDTCFALLFLAKATAPTTGPDQPTRKSARIANSAHSDVQWRLIGPIGARHEVGGRHF